MDGRKRTVQIKFRVTEAERDLILEKMKLVPTRNMEAYLRKMAIDGYIIQVDHSDIKAIGFRYGRASRSNPRRGYPQGTIPAPRSFQCGSASICRL